MRKALHAKGFRYRLHRKDLPGKPDLVFAQHQAVCFVHGCFWHRHKGCKLASTPQTRQDYWEVKFKNNQNRDRRNLAQLKKQGWRTAVVWECHLKKANSDQTIESLAAWLTDDQNSRSFVSRNRQAKARGCAPRQ